MLMPCFGIFVRQIVWAVRPEQLLQRQTVERREFTSRLW